jgi:hypothetical protein
MFFSLRSKLVTHPKVLAGIQNIIMDFFNNVFATNSLLIFYYKESQEDYIFSFIMRN